MNKRNLEEWNGLGDNYRKDPNIRYYVLPPNASHGFRYVLISGDSLLLKISVTSSPAQSPLTGTQEQLLHHQSSSMVP